MADNSIDDKSPVLEKYLCRAEECQRKLLKVLYSKRF